MPVKVTDRWIRTAQSAGGIGLDPNIAEARRQGFIDQQFTGKTLADAQNFLQNLKRL